MKENVYVEAQMVIGKQVLEIVLDLLDNSSKQGAVLPLNVNGCNLTITVEKS